MIPRELSRDALPGLELSPFGTDTVAILTPVGDDWEIAARCAWDLARAATRHRRRVALIDLSLEQPLLHPLAVEAATEGIVDAFVYGTSLTRVARQQDAAGLYFIGVGSGTTDPAAVWTDPRWSRLGLGFASEGALLIAFLPPEALGSCALEPDVIVLLGGSGEDWQTLPGVARRVRTGAGLWRVVWDAPPPAALPAEPVRFEPVPQFRPAPSPAAEPLAPANTPTRHATDRAPVTLMPGAEPPTQPGRPGIRRLLVAAAPILALLLVVTGWLGWERSQRARAAEAAPIVPRPVIASSTPITPDPEGRAGDSLFYAVQVAAFNSSDRALSFTRRFEDDLPTAAVTPVRVGNQGVWYRVILGQLSTSTAADSALQALWRRGLVERRQGTILRTPHALVVATHDDVASAQAATVGLRARGIPAYILKAPDGGARVLVGAFEAPEQASVAESLLVQTGLKPTLTTRSGIAP